MLIGERFRLAEVNQGEALSIEDIAPGSLLDAMPDATAILDSSGTIVAVNHAWKTFGCDNGGDESALGVGVNYFTVCDKAVESGCFEAGMVADALNDVLSGRAVEREFEYRCASPEASRWYLMRATPLGGGVLVSHLNISSRKAAEIDLARRASQDPLTGLNNRRSFYNHLKNSLRPRQGSKGVRKVGVLYLDLDRFKPINDKYGHAVGDEILQRISNRLLSATRKGAVVGRLGGDEFAVLIPRISEDELPAFVARIGAAVSEPILAGGVWVTVEASIGSYLASVGEDPDLCITRADQDMYAAKRIKAS